MKGGYEIFLDTDIIAEHLKNLHVSDETLLQKCLQIFDRCYTSVINAAEIFSLCKDKKEIEKAKISMSEINILGIPFRYSPGIGEVIKTINKKISGNTIRDAIVIAMCMETKLPFFTSKRNRYKDIPEFFNIKFINREIIINNNSAELIFKKANI